MRISQNALLEVAIAVRPHVTPFIHEHGMIPDHDLRRLIVEHTGRQIVSERSIQIINEYLTEM